MTWTGPNLRRWFTAVCVAVTAAGAARCGDNATPTTPQPPPVETVNTPPVITSLTVSSQRIEANDQVQLTATVTDAETPVDSLTYQWSASVRGGTITGTGRQVQWKAPAGASTPDTVTFTLTVVETYTSAGQPKQNQVTATVTSHYNDSVKEIGDLGLQFLTDFATFSVTPEQCVRNFSDSCRGKQDELSDIQYNRTHFHILNADLTLNSVNVSADRTTATALIACTFYDIPNSTGVREKVPGLCTLTAVYENWRWWLCESHFANTGPATPYDLQFRVPGKLSDRVMLKTPVE